MWKYTEKLNVNSFFVGEYAGEKVTGFMFETQYICIKYLFSHDHNGSFIQVL